MRKTFVATVLFAALALLSPGNAVAGPPNERSSAMMLDEVEDGLRRYRQQKTDDKRLEWLKRLAPSKDPRVKAALEAALSGSSDVVAEAADELLARHYDRYRNVPDAPRALPPPRPSGPPET